MDVKKHSTIVRYEGKTFYFYKKPITLRQAEELQSERLRLAKIRAGQFDNIILNIGAPLSAKWRFERYQAANFEEARTHQYWTDDGVLSLNQDKSGCLKRTHIMNAFDPASTIGAVFQTI